MKKSYIGIDPSMNSTGICIRIYNDDKIDKIIYRLVVPNKISKSQIKSINEIHDLGIDFNYIIYDKTDLKIFKDDYHNEEYWKTMNLLDIVNKSIDDIVSNINDCDFNYVLMEGISYGSSIRTKSVFDLAGLNYLFRMKILNEPKFTFDIGSPGEIKKYASGDGTAKKEMIIKLFEGVNEWATKIKKIDDLADAYFMSLYAKTIQDNKTL